MQGTLADAPATLRLARDQVHILGLLSRGCTMDQVARKIGVSDRTLRRKLRVICGEVGVATPVEAVVWAVRRRLI